MEGKEYTSPTPNIAFLVLLVLLNLLAVFSRPVAFAVFHFVHPDLPPQAVMNTVLFSNLLPLTGMLQSVLACFMVVFFRRKGFIAMLCMNLIALISAICAIILQRTPVISGLFSPLLGAAVASVIYLQLMYLAESSRKLSSTNEQLEQTNNKLFVAAYFDDLTGLENRKER